MSFAAGRADGFHKSKGLSAGPDRFGLKVPFYQMYCPANQNLVTPAQTGVGYG